MLKESSSFIRLKAALADSIAWCYEMLAHGVQKSDHLNLYAPPFLVIALKSGILAGGGWLHACDLRTNLGGRCRRMNGHIEKIK